jgi:hypothetical protein
MFHSKVSTFWLALLIGLSVIKTAHGEQVQLPIHVTNSSINEMVREYVFTGKNNTVRIGDDGSGCRFLQLSDPVSDTHKGLLRVRAKAHLRVGSRFGTQCIIALNWHGQAQILEQVVMTGEKNILKGKLVDAKLFSNEGRAEMVVNTAWQWAKPLIPAAFSTMKINLQPPVEQLKTILTAMVPTQNAVELQRMLDSLNIASTQVKDNGVDVLLNVELPAAATGTPAPSPVKALSDEEFTRLEKRFDSLDAFMTSVIKTVGVQQLDEQTRSNLFDILVDMRYSIRDALTERTQSPGVDPVRQLFISSWQQLAPIVRSIADHQEGAAALEYLSFISAADALLTLDTLGPRFGLDISTDGLRRLARILLPGSKQDPTQYDESMDPQLRRLFHFHTYNDSLQPERSGFMDWLLSSAWATDKPNGTVVKTLNTILPNKNNLDDYLAKVDSILRYAIDEQLKTYKIDDTYRLVYQNAVYTAAWQESCWRQYVNKKGKRVPLKSGTGDLGIMQVNARVWRGFYDPNGLRWDILYNTRAGSEILARYMKNYAIRKKEYKRPGGMDNLARSTYSAYNGGPRQYSRYRKKNIAKRLKKIDQLYYEKYLAVKEGNRLEVRSCLIGK